MHKSQPSFPKRKALVADESSKFLFSFQISYIKKKDFVLSDGDIGQLPMPAPCFSSVRPPHRFIHAASRVEHGWGVTVAPVAVHPPLRLAGQVGVHQGAARGGASARRDHPRGRTVSAGDHGELVGAGGSAVVEIRRAAGLEGRALALGRARVRRRQVGVVVGASQRHARGDGRGVGEGGRVVHPRAGEAALREGGEARELSIELTGERAQVGGTCRDTHTHTNMKTSRQHGNI